jgi:hypothetical protein
MAGNSSYSGGIGLPGLLGVLFIGLKLAGMIDWSWWWVTAPFWAAPALALAMPALGFVIAAFVMCVIAIIAVLRWAGWKQQ